MARVKKEEEVASELTLEALPDNEKSTVVDKLNQSLKVRIINEENSYKPPVRNEKIVLKPVNERLLRNSIATVLRPVLCGKTKRLITGQPYFTEEEKKNVIRVVDSNTERRLIGVVTLDLNNPIDAIDWEWMKVHPYIAPSKEEASKSFVYRYYVDNKDKSAEDFVQRKRYESSLIDRIMKLSLSKKRKLARILEVQSEEISEVELDKLLLELAQNDYNKPADKRITAILDDETRFNFLYLSKVLIDKGEITVEFGNYKYRNTLIATSYEEYLNWLNRPEQISFVNIKQNQYL